MNTSPVPSSSPQQLPPPQPPQPTTAASIATTITHIHSTLLTLPALSPSPTTNTLFTTLVTLCTRTYSYSTARTLLTTLSPITPSLRNLCSTAESLLEHHWSTLITTSSKTLNDFPYHSNYRLLAQLELSAIASVSTPKIQRLLFLGSGPLPLSCSLFAELLGADVVGGDICPLATAAATAVAPYLTASTNGKLSFTTMDALHPPPLHSYDVVVVAALVGATSSEKQRVLSGVATACKPGTLVVLRSAHGVRTLLYQPLEDVGSLSSLGLEVLVEVHPWGEVVNSVIVCRVLERGRL